jgi:integrase
MSDSDSTERSAHWPPRWARKHGSIYYRPRPEDREQWDDKSWFRLGASESEAWKTWHERIEPKRDDGGPPSTIGGAFNRYVAEVVPTLAPRTQKDYLTAITLMRPVFGHMRPSALKPRHVYEYMARRPKIRANREKATLSAVMSYCVRWGAIDRNLVKEVRRNRETPRDRYVTDDELDAFLSHCNPMLKAYVTLKMLTGLRQGQVLDLQRSNWSAEKGELTVPGAKAGRTVIYSGDTLAHAVNECLALQKGNDAVASMYILASRIGTRYTADGFRAIWQRAQLKYAATGRTRFTEHDLRAKVASDSESLESASNRLGHQTQSTTKKVYSRKPVSVTVLDRG